MKDAIKFMFPMNLQTFAEGDPDPTPADPDPTPQDPPKTFTQEELDKIVADRIARERKRGEERLRVEKEEAERKRLEEANEYKVLYEKTKVELEEERQSTKAAQLSVLKTTLLLETGYGLDQISRVMKYVTGDDEPTVRASIEELKIDLPPKVNNKPVGGLTNGVLQQATITKEQFLKMSYQERLRLFETSPELYRQLSK